MAYYPTSADEAKAYVEAQNKRKEQGNSGNLGTTTNKPGTNSVYIDRFQDKSDERIDTAYDISNDLTSAANESSDIVNYLFEEAKRGGGPAQSVLAGSPAPTSPIPGRSFHHSMQLGGAQFINHPQMGGPAPTGSHLMYGPAHVSAPELAALSGAPGSVYDRLGEGGASVAGQLGPAVGNIQLDGFDPNAIDAALGRLYGFLDQERGPSAAEAALAAEGARNRAHLVGLARSARGGAGAQAQAMRQAMSEGGQMLADEAGDLALLRAQEDADYRAQQLAGITTAGELGSAKDDILSRIRQQDLEAKRSDQATQLSEKELLERALAGDRDAANLLRDQDLRALSQDADNILKVRDQELDTRGQEIDIFGHKVVQRGQDVDIRGDTLRTLAEDANRQQERYATDVRKMTDLINAGVMTRNQAVQLLVEGGDILSKAQGDALAHQQFLAGLKQGEVDSVRGYVSAEEGRKLQREEGRKNRRQAYVGAGLSFIGDGAGIAFGK